MRRRPSSAVHAPAAPTIQTDISAQVVPPDGPRAPRGWQERYQHSEEMAVRSQALLEQIAQHTGGLQALATAVPRDDVLGAFRLNIPASGYLHRSWKVPLQSVHVANVGTAPVTVASSGGLTQAPTLGSGVFTVAPGVARTVQLRGSQLSVYGTPGQPVEITAFSRPREPSAGLISATGVPPAGVLVPAGTTLGATGAVTGQPVRSLVVVLSITAVTGSVTLAINGITPSGYSYPILAPAGVNAVGVSPYRIGPGLTPSAGAVANDVVPDNVQVVATVAGSATYGVDYVAGI